MWFGTGNGLSSFDGINWVSYPPGDLVPNRWVTSVAVDDQNNKWIATGGGTVRFDGLNWTSIFNSDLRGPICSQTVVIDKSGAIWIGSCLDGVWKYVQ